MSDEPAAEESGFRQGTYMGLGLALGAGAAILLDNLMLLPIGLGVGALVEAYYQRQE